jgi:hypothetical protein
VQWTPTYTTGKLGGTSSKKLKERHYAAFLVPAALSCRLFIKCLGSCRAQRKVRTNSKIAGNEEPKRSNWNFLRDGAASIGRCNTGLKLLAEVSKIKVFPGR